MTSGSNTRQTHRARQGRDTHRPRALRPWIAALVGFLFLPLAALAHDPFTSWTNARFRADHLEVETTLSRGSTLMLLPNWEKLPSITPENFPERAPALQALAGTLFQVTAAGVPLEARTAEVKLGEESPDMDVIFRVTFPLPTAGPVRFTGVYLEKMVDEHVGTLLVSNDEGKDLGWEPLSLQTIYLEVPLPAMPGTAAAAVAPVAVTPSFTTFLHLGIEHILTGYDHLLFLCGLIVACRRFRTMAVIITCFTVAHSITLALAALNIFALPGRIVEPLIAASIVFVGIENLVRRGEEPRGRWALTFGFGLIHGFGFASVLQQIGLGKNGSSLLVPLFSFNLGVELGQIAVAAVFLPLLFALRRRPAFAKYGPVAVSAFVVLAGSYWLLERTVFS